MMRKKLLSISMALLGATASLAQTEQLGPPASWHGIQLPAEVFTMPPVNNTAEIEQEMTRRSATQEKFYKFGHDEHVAIDFMQEAQITTLTNGEKLRLLRIRSTGAVSINLIFSEFELAKGAKLYLYDKVKKTYIGAHTDKNNNDAKVLGTDIVPGDEIVIELVEPAAVAGTSRLTIGNVVHAFLDLNEEASKVLNQSGDCEYDVNCPIGAGWEKQRNATVMLVNTNGFCTGSLINNTSGTVIPYVLTANHCGGSPAPWVFRFRWEAPAAQADCATPASSVNGPENMNVNGGTKKASSAASDFHLILLNAAPDPAWDIYYNGWDKTEYVSQGGVGVHHPRGDIKKISFENEPLISTTFATCPPNSHWGVTNWDNGVTEPASSGSPLFNTSHSKRTIGQLHGGASSCTAAQKSDEYGKLSVSWEGEGTSDKRLKDWLDPSGTGADIIDGFDPNIPVSSLDAGIDNPNGVLGTVCAASTVTPTIKIYNPGTTTLTSAVITYAYDGGSSMTYNWSGSLQAYYTETITLPVSGTLTSGFHTFFAQVSLPNGGADQKAVNDTVSSRFRIVAEPVYASLSLTLDCFGTETSWKLTDTEGSILYTGSGYANSDPGQTINQTFCLAKDCYTFTITDKFGDGMDGGSSCEDDGHFVITDDITGDTLAELPIENANFGSVLNKPFCMDENLALTHLDQLEWSIFPNPVTSELTIKLPAVSGSITVRSAAGQFITSLTTTGAEEKIDVSGLAKGVYFITLTSDRSVTTKTFVVQ